jgi:hypothetical protein
MDYFELYYAYLAWCEKDNWANMRDPNHDYMEWNHTLPQCIFGDQPIGQWLTIEQHAVASALQTLVYRRNCLCAWHKKHLPPLLLPEVWTFYVAHKSKVGKKCALDKKGVHSDEWINSPERVAVNKKVGNHTKRLGIGIFGRTLEKMQEDARRSVQVQVSKGLGWYSPELRDKTREINKKPILVLNPEGEEFMFPSIGEAASFLKIHPSGITKYLSRGKPLSKGRLKGFFFRLIRK